MTGINRAVRAASQEGKTCPQQRKQAGETPKRHAKEKGLVLKVRKRANMTSKGHAKGLVLKIRKQADMTSKGHAKVLLPQSKEGSRHDLERACKSTSSSR